MTFRWRQAPSDPSRTLALAGQLGLSPLLVQCLLNRGLESPEMMERYLQPRLKNLAEPGLLPEMEPAVTRLLLARQAQEKIVIFGDYDVDGVTSSALLVEVLRHFGWLLEVYLPHRMEEGYGLSREAVETCLQKFHPGLILAVDCGSTAYDTIASLRARGIDTIVLDHHQLSDPPPPAVALVNPRCGSGGNQPTGGAGIPVGQPFHELCSVGLAFKLAHAVVKKARELAWPGAESYDLRPLLDLVALGTIADIVPLIGENRILVHAGLARLRDTRRPGLTALKSVAGIEAEVRVYEVGFQLGPRLNAAGRLEDARSALDLLMATESVQADRLARELDSRNRERQGLEREIATQVIAAVRARFDPSRDFVIIEGQLLWHIGVVGIVASRVLREFYRPTIIIGGDGNEWRGSGRSIEGFDLAGALRACDDLLIRHGGHAAAAGLSVHPDKIDALRVRLNELVRTTVAPELLEPALRLDQTVNLGDLTLEMMEELLRLEPFGQGNPPVQLLSRNLTLERPPQRLGKEQKHLKMRVRDGIASHDAVWWNCPAHFTPPKRFDLAFVPQINEYNGRRTIQLKVLDLRAA